MELNQRLITYILKTAPVTMDTLLEVAQGKGYTELEVLNALDAVHRDKRITQTANSAGVVTYKLAAVKERPDPAAWIREHYPPMDSTNDGSGLPGDYGYMFLKTLEERNEYKAAAKGVPVHMVKSKYGNTRR